MATRPYGRGAEGEAREGVCLAEKGLGLRRDSSIGLPKGDKPRRAGHEGGGERGGKSAKQGEVQDEV